MADFVMDTLNTTVPTVAPTAPGGGAPHSYIPVDDQFIVMGIAMVVIGVFLLFSCCMSREGAPLYGCLNSLCGCRCFNCECKCCKAKDEDEDENGTGEEEKRDDDGNLVVNAATARRAKATLRDDYFFRAFGGCKSIGADGTESVASQQQLWWMLWKSWQTKRRAFVATVMYFVLPCTIFLVIYLLYATFAQGDSSGAIEVFLAPFAFVIVLQASTVSLVTEKSLRLVEAMRMTGLREAPYWGSLVLFDGVVMGAALSFILTCIAAVTKIFHNGGAGNGPNADPFGFGDVFGLVFMYCLALTSMAFTFSTVFSSPQTAGQASFLLLVGSVVLFVVFCLSADGLIDTQSEQRAWCLLPPFAFELGVTRLASSFAKVTYNPTTETFQRGAPSGPLGLVAVVSLREIIGMLLLDVVLYAFVAWYLGQILPSEFGVQRAPWFILSPSYWFGGDDGPPPPVDGGGSALANPLINGDGAASRAAADDDCPTEPLVLPAGQEAPTVAIRGLSKTFGGSFRAVNNLSFDMCEGEIFSLLGHNGAGKTTTINMLTGMFSPDAASGNTTIYGHAIRDAMPRVRGLLGCCPQHDVLFESLTVREHIIFFALVKRAGTPGARLDDAEAEADELLAHFRLHERAAYVGAELSGGMRRKLSTAIALCGGSKFVVLDEPTAGMDPLARRELWDLLRAMRAGRTMLLTTHYMDEADVLGDRIAIMAHGKLQCNGSSNFLKRTFGAGYKLIATMAQGAVKLGGGADTSGEGGIQLSALQMAQSLQTAPAVVALERYIAGHVPGAQLALKESTENTLAFVLPFDGVGRFGAFFSALDAEQARFGVVGYGVAITDLEEVFLRVGEDRTVKNTQRVAADGGGDEAAGGSAAPGGLISSVDPDDLEASAAYTPGGIGGSKFVSTYDRQVVGLWKKRVSLALNDFKTIPLLLVPIAASVAAFAVGAVNAFGGELDTNIAISAIAMAGFIPLPGLIAEAVVSERATRLRNVLTVMGCDVKTYWIGTLAGDMSLALVISCSIVIIAFVCSAAVPDKLSPWSDARLFALLPLSAFQICSFAYAVSFAFDSPRSAIVFVPLLVLLLIFFPVILISVFNLAFGDNGADVFQLSPSANVGAIFWGVALCSPHGALFLGFADISVDFENLVENNPPFWAICIIMAAEGALYARAAYSVDSQALVDLPRLNEPLPRTELAVLDPDVVDERAKVLAMAPNEIASGDFSLRVAGLRKLYPPKEAGAPPLAAVRNLSFRVARGELFGLLGANGAGKSSAISCVMRATYATAGDAHVAGHSVLDDFHAAATCLGVVAQQNTLWDRLSCRAHLKLFARLRGVPATVVDGLVEAVLVQMELTPYAERLSMNLSGGMKRKLCVAVALIGDPQVVLLDEPSAGLDPVSRRNLWDVIRTTMGERAVVLTTHSMEEAEALCTRIGIMVKGQLRVVGTPQHLKDKYGSGYEIVAQLDAAAPPGAALNVAAHLEATFGGPRDVELLSDNGGLLTFRVAREKMRIGDAFATMEAHKARLGVADYSLAQPTLEQVFVRTVTAHSARERPPEAIALGEDGQPKVGREYSDATTTAASPMHGGSFSSAGGVPKLKRTGSSSSAGDYATPFTRASLGDNPELANDDEYGSILRTEWCGLNRAAWRFLATSTGLLCLLLWVSISGLAGSYSYDDDSDEGHCHRSTDSQPCSVPAFYLNGVPLIFALIISIIGCMGCCCCIPKEPDA